MRTCSTGLVPKGARGLGECWVGLHTGRALRIRRRLHELRHDALQLLKILLFFNRHWLDRCTVTSSLTTTTGIRITIAPSASVDRTAARKRGTWRVLLRRGELWSCKHIMCMN